MQVNVAVHRRCHPAFDSLEAAMTKCTKDTFGYLGTEPMVLREQLDRLAAALEKMAKAEGAEAMKAASEAAKRLGDEATAMLDDLAGKAHSATAAADRRRAQVEGVIRDRPWLAVSLAAAAGFLLASLVRR
jgi:ElaB/YqjD/DUF883 family membrane-anchored ribosome-binding protein